MFWDIQTGDKEEVKRLHVKPVREPAEKYLIGSYIHVTQKIVTLTPHQA
ncbi:hypothetical protein ACIA8G_40440 [Lentzea sp. NPDC051213]